MSSKLDKETLNIEKQIRLLESLDSKSCEDAKQSLVMLVEHGKGIPNLVNYFCISRSERALEILYRVADPHHNVLLDTLKHIMKDKKLQDVLTLLGQILQRQPSWVNQVVYHSLFNYVILFLRNAKPIVVQDVTTGMFFMSTLVSMCTDVPQQAFMGFFNFFIQGCETYALLLANVKEEKAQSSSDRYLREKFIKDEVEPDHCSVALREYFQALYGIFPIQFTGFLRSYFAEKSEKKKQVIQRIVLSLINGVRFHPYLIFRTKEWEMSSQRYEDKTDAPFFLDQIKQLTIGMIPVPVSFDGDEQFEDQSPSLGGGLSSKDRTFTFAAFENDSSSSSAAAWMEETANLLEMINTPPGSRPGSPTRKAVETNSPIVLTTEPKIRRPSGDGVRQTRFGSISSSISTMLKRSERKSVVEPAVIEIVKGSEDGRRSSQCDSENLYDEAEDALEDLPNLDFKDAERRKYYNSAPSGSATVSLSEGDEQTSPGSVERSRPPTVNEIVEEVKQTTSSLLEAAKAARAAVQERKKQATEMGAEVPLTAIRSRSASVKPITSGHVLERGRTSTMDAGLLNSATDSDSGEIGQAEPIEKRGTRFSVTSYFNKLNRQRFVSECPQRVELPVSEQAPLSARALTLDRTFSCPDLDRESSSYMDSKKFDVQRKSYNARESPKKAIGFFDRHPFLKQYYQPLDMSYLHQLEERFASNQEKSLGLYMGASKSYHNCLKDLGLADRLPGRIYDDLSHISDGVPLEKQRNLLRARLQLVNQHLMYERSCRLLHALRNRRLFVQICGENNLKAQLLSERQLNFTIREEVESLRQGLTAKRKEMIDLRKTHERRQMEMTAEYKKMRMDAYKSRNEYQELSNSHALMQKEHAESKLKMEKQMRRADDAEEILRRQETELAVMKERMEELKRAHEDNSSLKEQLIMFETCPDRLKSPEVEERMKQALYNELDRVTKEREAERLLKEELREKIDDLELCLKTEQARSEKFVHDLARSAKVLREQNEAAEQKFLSLQMVNEKHLELINDLYVQLETAKDAEASFKASTKCHDDHGEIPLDPPPSLLGTATTEPTASFAAPINQAVEQGVFDFDYEPNELEL